MAADSNAQMEMAVMHESIQQKSSRSQKLWLVLAAMLILGLIVPGVFNYLGIIGSATPWSSRDLADYTAAELYFAPISEYTKRAEVLASPIESLRQEYQASVGGLERTLYLQCLMVLIGFVVLLSSEKDGEPRTITLFDVDVPVAWMHPAVAIVALTLWLQFGFIIDECIKLRAVLSELFRLQYLRLPHLDYVSYADMTSLNDSGFVDGWFVSWRPNDHVIDPSSRPWAIAVVLFVYGSVVGVAHAVTLGLPSVAITRYAGRPAYYHLVQVSKTLLWGGTFLIVASHLLFLFGGRNPNLLQPCIAVVAIAGLYWLHRIARR